MNKLLTLLLLFSVWSIRAQQPSPIGIIFNPRVNTFAVSGVGGGNLYEMSASKNSTSGQLAFDYNIALTDTETKKGKEKLTTLTPLVKYNPLLNATYNVTDTMDIRKLAFIDNEFMVMFGLRYSQLKQFGSGKNSRQFNSAFFDFTYTPYKLKGSANPLNTGFANFNFNLGWQWGFISNLDFGYIGMVVSPQVNFISVYEDKADGQTLEDVLYLSEKVGRKYLGTGLKINVPINDFSIFFETRKYFSLDTSAETPNLTDRMIFSVGGVATGTVLKSRTKEMRE